MIAISDQSKLSKLGSDSNGGAGGGGGIFAQWPQWNADYKGRSSWSPQKWFSAHAAAVMPYPRVAPFHGFPAAQYGSDLFPLYTPSGSGSNGSPVPQQQGNNNTMSIQMYNVYYMYL